jgi:hypothetical protein
MISYPGRKFFLFWHRFFALRCSHTPLYAPLRCSKISDFWLSLENREQALKPKAFFGLRMIRPE